jgi:hypothetical protein
MTDRDSACLSGHAMDWLEMQGFDGGECWAIQKMARLAREQCRPGVLWLRDDQIAYALRKRYRFVMRLVDKMITERVIRARRDHLERRVYELTPQIVPPYPDDPRDSTAWDGDWSEELERTEAAIGLAVDAPEGDAPDVWQPQPGLERNAMFRWRNTFSLRYSRSATPAEQAEALRLLRAWIAEGRSPNDSRPAQGFVEDWFRQREQENETGKMKREEVSVSFPPFHSSPDDDNDDSLEESFLRENTHHHQRGGQTKRNETPDQPPVSLSTPEPSSLGSAEAQAEVVRLLAREGVWKKGARALAKVYAPDLVRRFIAAQPYFHFEQGKWAAYLYTVLQNALDNGGDPADDLPEKFLAWEVEQEARQRQAEKQRVEREAQQARESALKELSAGLDAEFSALRDEVQAAVDGEATELWRTVGGPGSEALIARYWQQRRAGKAAGLNEAQFLPYRHAALLLYRTQAQRPMAEKQQGKLAHARRLHATPDEQQEVRDSVRRHLAAQFPDLARRIQSLDPTLAGAYQRLTVGEWLRRAEAERSLSPEEAAAERALAQAAMEKLPDQGTTEEENA